jgi:hypothetical protein
MIKADGEAILAGIEVCVGTSHTGRNDHANELVGGL